MHSSASGSDKRGVNGVGGIGSDEGESDDGEEGDYTVYECPGLAPVSRGKLCFANPRQLVTHANGEHSLLTYTWDVLLSCLVSR